MVPVPSRLASETQIVFLTAQVAANITNEAILEQKYPYLAEIFTDIKKAAERGQNRIKTIPLTGEEINFITKCGYEYRHWRGTNQPEYGEIRW